MSNVVAQRLSCSRSHALMHNRSRSSLRVIHIGHGRILGMCDCAIGRGGALVLEAFEESEDIECERGAEEEPVKKVNESAASIHRSKQLSTHQSSTPKAISAPQTPPGATRPPNSAATDAKPDSQNTQFRPSRMREKSGCARGEVGAKRKREPMK